MKEQEKKGLLQRIFGGSKKEQGSCCCNYQLIEITDEAEQNNPAAVSKDDKPSCCSK